MKISQFTLSISAALILGAACSRAEPVGTIVSIRGKASAVEPSGRVRTLALKSPVSQLDKIRTEENSSLQMMLLDESVISLGARSEMTIDEYVYSPDDPSGSSCLLSLGNGVFRAVTARLTALNPERFKIKTGLAVIGIRGCEVAFTITERSDSIYVLSLPDGKSIVITLNEGVDLSALTSKGLVEKDGAIRIVQAGVMVQIEEDGGATLRQIDQREAIDLIREFTGPSGFPPAAIPQNELTDAVGQENNMDALEEAKKNRNQELTPPSSPNSPPLAVESSEVLPSPLAVESSEVLPPPLKFAEMGNGTGWKWGVWQYPGPIFEIVQFYVEEPYSLISSADVLTFVSLNSGSGFNLTGVGSTAVLVRDGVSRYLLSGECGVSFNVSVGGATSWAAETQAFGSPMPISDGSHSLYFMINGTVDGNGVLQGSFTLYTLDSGLIYNQGTIESSSINASLIGPSALSIDGIMGHFDVKHVNGPSVQGGFSGSSGF